MHGSPQPPAFDGTLSTTSVSSTRVRPTPSSWELRQVDSMVEIKRSDLDSQDALAAPGSAEASPDDSRYRLIYSKSKVYVNPTAYARDNIPGFVALEAAQPIYLLAWIPESLLNEKGPTEWDKFARVEEHSVTEDEDEDGSIAINLISGSTLPTLHFHDDESRSFTLPAKSPVESRPMSYPPAPSESAPKGSTWGGENLLTKLRSYCHILRSCLQSNLYLIDPSRDDIETHSTPLFSDDAVDDILAQSSYANSHSPIPAHRRPRPLSTTTNPYSERSSILHKSLSPVSTSSASASPARLALLQSFSQITRHAAHAAQHILSHPLAKPIIPHLPDPVRSLVNANGDLEWGSWVEKGGVGEFESARVYLARWARIVAEEGERARLREAQALPAGTSDLAEEDSSLGIFELLQSTTNLPRPKSSRDPLHPVTRDIWSSWFDSEGVPKIRKEEMRREVFQRGVTSDIRKDVWPFVLGVHGWDGDAAQRTRDWETKRYEATNLFPSDALIPCYSEQYRALKDEWWGVPDVFERQDIIEERHRIDVDCRRTDRTQPLFAQTTPSPEDAENEKGMHMRYSTISPQLGDIGAQAPTNEHIERLASVLLTYNFYEKELGYVQGMSDLCAPVYVVMGGDEEMTFWCFVEIMERMKHNFLRDQSGMKKQLSTLQQLISVMDPELYRHLEKTDGLNLFFCFRWILITFKREFPFDDVLRLWEVLWTDYYSTQFVLFVALAVLESHRDVILRYLVEFDEILKYCNELSMSIELDSTLAQAEVLFLSFSQLVADIDRKAAETSSPAKNIRRRRTGSVSAAAPVEIKRTIISEELRELLKAGQ
ncbi:GTPase-activating protein gyp7 [Trametes pubescens]|uniref:GTPase-activating protein gyp7 n=1 Tax=Trametes pubescens TaxID=154538 RepID=A0A1M2VU70_TRAPU|nr:GTPase-activating protein gyp7 [Trametes pubescens]